MESKISSSFIPKKPVVQTGSPRYNNYKSSGLDIFMLIAVVMTVISGVLAAGVFLYKNHLNATLDDKKASLQKAKQDMDEKFINKMMTLSKRIQVAGNLLDLHTAPSLFFMALQRDTLKSIQILEFTYKKKSDNMATFNMKGKTASVNSVALQSQRFADSDLIKNAIFSDIKLVKDGVIFKVDGDINLDNIRFASAVQSIPPVANSSQDQTQGFVTDQANGDSNTIDTNNTNNASTTTQTGNPAQDSLQDFGAFGQ